jgi:hypothetical protein
MEEPMMDFSQRCIKGALLVLGAAGFAALLPAPPAWSATKEAPACAAIGFRSLPSGLTDGDQDAGLYKSRFGRITVTGTVKGGQVEGYYVTVDGTRPPDAGTLPASVASCAAAKHMPAPGKPETSCVGDRLQVLIDHSGAKRYVLLYARQSGKWGLCSAGTA